MSQSVEKVVIVHPEDINLADAKRLAADYNTTVEASPYVPRGQVFLTDSAALRFSVDAERAGGAS